MSVILCSPSNIESYSVRFRQRRDFAEVSSGRSSKFRVLVCACCTWDINQIAHASHAVWYSFEGLRLIAPIDQTGNPCTAELDWLKDSLRVRRKLNGMPAAFPLTGFHLISPHHWILCPACALFISFTATCCATTRSTPFVKLVAFKAHMHLRTTSNGFFCASALVEGMILPA